MLVLIVIPIWLLAWVGISILVCPFLGFVSGGNAIDCALIVVGGGGVVIPLLFGVGYMWLRNRAPG